MRIRRARSRRPGSVVRPSPAAVPRLVLAAFALISCLILAPVLFTTGAPALAWIVVALAATALVDLAATLRRPH